MTLADWGNVASIATAIFAIFAVGKYLIGGWFRRRRLECYLREEKRSDDKGQRTLVHLMGNVGMTEAQILEAAFSKCSKIKRVVTKDASTGLAKELLFEYRC